MKRGAFLKTLGLGTASLPFVKPATARPVQNQHPLVKPRRLKEGDTIALTAPAGIVYGDDEFDKMQEALESFGLNVRFGEFVRRRYGYFSGTDHQRALDLNRFFADSSVDAIMAVRGGWGGSRILPHLDFDLIARNPKIYCGFSDNTTLHLAFLKQCRMVSYHGPNGNSDWTGLTKESFRNVLMEGKKASFHSNSYVETITPGTAEGPLIGGNLTILTTSLGTGYQPDVSGAVLFVEDVGEPVYKVDRMLTHLKSSGMLDQINGFIFGRCTNCENGSGDNRFTMMEIFQHHIKPLGIPAIYGADIGHEEDNFTLPIGIPARLDAGEGTFRLLESGVDLGDEESE
ncbi:MAG: LD-carboxypeptidase [Balneolaceae bacterium]